MNKLEQQYVESMEQQLTVAIGLHAANADDRIQPEVRALYRKRMDALNEQTCKLQAQVERMH